MTTQTRLAAYARQANRPETHRDADGRAWPLAIWNCLHLLTPRQKRRALRKDRIERYGRGPIPF